MNIRLCEMTVELAKEFFRDFAYDPDVFTDGQRYQPFVYSDAYAEQRLQRQAQLHRVYLAILADEAPIGEIILKNIHKPEGSCTLSIHLQNDSVKNRGYGTQTEWLALQYAFEVLGMKTVYADALLKNTRSQHVLERAGFRKIHEDKDFVYFRCDRHKVFDW